MGRKLVLAAVFAAAAGAARAADAPLPAFAAMPPPSALLPAGGGSAAVTAPLAEPESIYHGLYAGAEVFGVGGHNIKGGFGADAYAGYERQLASGLLVGLQGGAGTGPAIVASPGLKGWDFGEASASVGYPLGRLTPFVTAGVLVARPVVGQGFIVPGATGGLDGLMNGPGALSAAPRVGAGFTYALTPNTAVTFDVQVGRGLAAGLP